MKTYLAVVALLTAVAAQPGSAVALTTWRCVATPPGVPDDPHHGTGYTRDEAASDAIQRCKADHDDCVIQDCHVHHSG